MWKKLHKPFIKKKKKKKDFLIFTKIHSVLRETNSVNKRGHWDQPIYEVVVSFSVHYSSQDLMYFLADGVNLTQIKRRYFHAKRPARRIFLVLMGLRYLEQSVRNIKFLQNFVT